MGTKQCSIFLTAWHTTHCCSCHGSPLTTHLKWDTLKFKNPAMMCEGCAGALILYVVLIHFISEPWVENELFYSQILFQPFLHGPFPCNNLPLHTWLRYKLGEFFKRNVYIRLFIKGLGLVHWYNWYFPNNDQLSFGNIAIECFIKIFLWKISSINLSILIQCVILSKLSKSTWGEVIGVEGIRLWRGDFWNA